MLKYFTILGLSIAHSIIYAGGIPSNSILGFGTQKIDESNVELIQGAIDAGYRLFDGAQLYKNFDVIAESLEKNRDKVYFIYKISPPKSLEDIADIKLDIEKVIEKLGKIDCLMLHSINEFYDNIDTDFGQHIIDYIKELLSRGKISDFGISNVGARFKEIIEDFKNRGIRINFVENKFDNNELHGFPTEDIVNYCKDNSIKFVAYGALGGVIHPGVCQAYCQVSQPAIHFDETTHPHIISLSKKYAVDPMMLVLAFEAKKYGVYQIPTTTRSKRIKSNFADFAKAYIVLQDDDIAAISNDIGLAIEPDFSSIPQMLRSATDYRSRLRLIQDMISNNHPLIETILKTKYLFDNDDDEKLFINKMLYIYEQAKKFAKEDELVALLKHFNTLATDSNQKRFRPIFASIFNLQTNQASGSLVDQFMQALRIDLPLSELLQGYHFTLLDDSSEQKNWPTRKIVVIDLDTRKIVKFDAKPPLSPGQLKEKLLEYGIGHVLSHASGTQIDLNQLPHEENLAGGFQSILPSRIRYFAAGRHAHKDWAKLILNHNPFTHQDLYK